MALVGLSSSFLFSSIQGLISHCVPAQSLYFKYHKPAVSRRHFLILRTRFQTDENPAEVEDISRHLLFYTQLRFMASSSHLSDLLDLGPAFPDEGAALARRDHQPQGDWRLAGHRAVSHQGRQVLKERGRENRWIHNDIISTALRVSPLSVASSLSLKK